MSYVLLTTEQNGLRAATPIYFYPLEDTQICFLFLKASVKMQTNPNPWTFVSCSLWGVRRVPQGPLPQVRQNLAWGRANFSLRDRLGRGFSEQVTPTPSPGTAQHCHRPGSVQVKQRAVFASFRANQHQDGRLRNSLEMSKVMNARQHLPGL